MIRRFLTPIRKLRIPVYPTANTLIHQRGFSEARRKHIDQEFDRVDVNKDGVISREEFLDAYVQQPGTSSLVRQIIDESGWPTCQVDTPAQDILKAMRESKAGWLVVTSSSMDMSDIQGILTEKDIVQQVLNGKGEMNSLQAKDFMTPKEKLITVSASDSVWDVTRIFIEKNIRAAPVLDDGKLIGFVSVRDAVAQLVEDHSSEVLSLSAYVNGSY
mmetsp:Transcript_254/g.342  ORF Transcript_254/g.342 Transcript_254/m.342 type:complete len:216 (-) Transcript_254:310-957(-)|eukprot:CAMPEP_0184485286 /NCGR_PEP_ID=MMETSP0113_2-20130426/6910_1 /TAXON_ID=91329 /ORGANISM="Norrisiella sphaerica, Strain BC52" /LENGTH=215 /DNA_ID=CAMNT_0026866675 /DNA_START=187 /DNA_END=834 /DNA_ORIENTATION=+